MKLIAATDKTLPPLAWVAYSDSSTVRLSYGQGVQEFSSGIFEGGWSLTDSPERCDPNGWYAGTGIFLHEGKLKAIAPSHTLEAIYVVRHGDHLWASNSMALAIVSSNWRDFSLSDVSSRVWAVAMGIGTYPRLLLNRRSSSLFRYCLSVIELQSLSEQRHEPLYQFPDFAAYERFLLSVASDVMSSSRSSACTTYLSRGYDSVACGALASKLGGGNSLSLSKGRTGLDDSGVPIASILGLDPHLITPVKRPTHIKNGQTFTEFAPSDASHVAEFCVGFGIEDECLSAPVHLVKRRLVLTGFHGDKVWDVNEPPSLDVKRGDSSGSSLYEFKLRAGFTHLPVPMIGALKHSDIYQISNSPEMSPWRVGGTYDRPIPRRIGEESGVPRTAFGQRKSAAATASEPLGDLKDVYFNALMDRYRQRQIHSRE